MAIIADQNQGCGCGQGNQNNTGTPVDNNIVVPKKYVYIDWGASASPETQIRNYINNLPLFEISGNELYFLYNFKNQTQVQQEDYSAEIHTWVFRRGKGSYGTNGSDSVENDTLLYYLGYTRSNQSNIEHYLGDIGAAAINYYIDQQSVTFSINNSAWNVFSCIQNGVAVKYVYIGGLDFVGNAAQPEVSETSIDDYLNVTGQPVYPPTPTDFITKNELDKTLYDKAKYYLTDEIANVNISGGEDFALIETDNDFYFASKETNEETFEDSSIKPHNLEGKRFELAAPDLVQDGYNFWQLSTGSNVNYLQNNGFVWFQLWQQGGGTTTEIIEISTGGNYHNTNLTGNVINLVNTNAQAIFTGFYSTKYKRLTLINNGDYEAILNNEDANSLQENQIKLPTGLASIGVEGTCELVYIDSLQKWQITDAFASKYRPEHRGLTEMEVEVVMPGAISQTHKTIDYEVYRDAQSTSMSKAELEAAYPNAERGTQVICEQINTIYKKVKLNPVKWVEINIKEVL